MHTGQNSTAPENSLPQLGQVRWGSVLMALPALQPQPRPTATPRSHRVVRNRSAHRLALSYPVARAIACCVIVARQITFRNRISAAQARTTWYAFYRSRTKASAETGSSGRQTGALSAPRG